MAGDGDRGSDDVRPPYRVQRAFDAALGRMCAAESLANLEDELSNMLAHLYRLGQFLKLQLGDVKAYYALLRSSDDLRSARAAMWARGLDTHGLHEFAALGTSTSDFFTNLMGTLEWRPLAELPPLRANYGQDRDYHDRLAQRPVLDTLRIAFDALKAECET